MDLSHVPVWTWVLLGSLLVLSGSFSATETALFSLRDAERDRAPRAVKELLASPRNLLVTVLLGNLLVNVLFFAFATRLTPPPSASVAASAGQDTGARVIVGVAALLAVVVCGEILPKTAGLRARVLVARVFGPPLLLLVVALGPVRRVVAFALELVVRMLGPRFREGRGLTPERLARVLERSAEHGVLHDTEAGFLAEIVELDGIRVREIMTPRVDMLMLDLAKDDREDVLRRALEERLSWLPVVDGGPDEVVGRVAVRDLVNQPDRPMRQLVMPAKYVPEVASALDLLHGLRDERVAEAIVVDEWGGTAGVVTIEDIFEEIVGDLREEEEDHEVAVTRVAEGRYRVNGGLSIRDWNDEFDELGARVVPTEFETVGGFVAALLGRIPRPGDVVRYGSLVMEVREVRGRRVVSVEMYVEQNEGAPA
jgi:putative hemolysin